MELFFIIFFYPSLLVSKIYINYETNYDTNYGYGVRNYDTEKGCRMRYGYVSRKIWKEQETILKVQKKKLLDEGVTVVLQETIQTPMGEYRERNKLFGKLGQGDELVIAQLDRIADSLMEGVNMIETLVQKGAIIHVLDIGIINDTPEGRIILGTLKAAKVFGGEQNKEEKKRKEGRPKKYDEEKMAHAAELLETYTYKEVVEMTGISKSTLIRYVNRRYT